MFSCSLDKQAGIKQYSSHLVLYSACKHRRLGALRSQVDSKQVYVRRRRKRLKGLKAT